MSAQELYGDEWKYNPEYHRLAEFLEVNKFDREDIDLAKKMSIIWDWARIKKKGNSLEDGSIGTSSTALSANDWHRLELKVDTTGAAGAHIVELKINGTVEVTASNRSIIGNAGIISVGGNIAAEAQTQGDWFFDDVAVNDSTGSFQNTYPDAGAILHLRPSATGDNSAWTGTNTDIDEITPDDATTLISSNTDGQREDVNIDNTSAVIDIGSVINLVSVGVRLNGVGASANATFTVEISASAGGTYEQSANIIPTDTTWDTNADNIPRIYPLILYDLPGASTTTWTKTDLDNAQIGANLITSSTNAAQVTTLWLLVDFTASPATNIFPFMTTNKFWGS